MPQQTKIFISYSHKDEKLREKLETHLSQMRNDGLMSEWHDRMIPAGREWKGEIDRQIEAAELVLLLISPDFLASNYCYAIETQVALRRHEAGEARVIPVILRPCDWSSAPFAKVQGLPKDGKPITKWNNKDDGWLSVANGIRKALADMQAAKAAAKPRSDGVDPNWKQKLDRIEQTGTARYLVGDMLKHGHPRCVCFCWYGAAHGGITVFHDRLETEFAEVSADRCWSVRPAWPQAKNASAFRGMLKDTFALTNESWDSLGAYVRQFFRGMQDRRQLLYVNHAPIESSLDLRPRQLQDYLRWWDAEVLGELEPQQVVVIGISFKVSNHVQFRHAVESVLKTHRFSDRFVFRFLPVLAPLEKEDIRTFFKRISIPADLDDSRLDCVIEKILADTGGEYDLVVRELELLLTEGFAKFANVTAISRTNDDLTDFGY